MFRPFPFSPTPPASLTTALVPSYLLPPTDRRPGGLDPDAPKGFGRFGLGFRLTPPVDRRPRPSSPSPSRVLPRTPDPVFSSVEDRSRPYDPFPTSTPSHPLPFDLLPRSLPTRTGVPSLRLGSIYLLPRGRTGLQTGTVPPTTNLGDDHAPPPVYQTPPPPSVSLSRWTGDLPFRHDPAPLVHPTFLSLTSRPPVSSSKRPPESVVGPDIDPNERRGSRGVGYVPRPGDLNPHPRPKDRVVIK